MLPMKLFGLPLFGVILPFIGRRRIYLNRDGSIVDTGKVDILDERGPLYIDPVVIEWLGAGFPIPGRWPMYEAQGVRD